MELAEQVYIAVNLQTHISAGARFEILRGHRLIVSLMMFLYFLISVRTILERYAVHSLGILALEPPE
jgi:hypothetical protein